MKRKTIYIIVAILLTLSATAQVPVAEFTGTPLSGCAPLVVHFQDQSTGNPKFWDWDFGNGQLSNIQNPVAVYQIPGTYAVTLVVRNLDGTNAVTKTDYVTVFPSPSASFVADITTGCVPVTVHFTDRSTSSAGTINKWEWDFGDGGKSNTQNPQHTYTASGFYSVSLKVTSTSGCSSAASISRYIRVVSGIVPDFSNALPSNCRPPFNVTMNNQTSGPGTLDYIWDLGNGTVSSAINPTTSYAAPGSYTVKLVALSSLGCADSVQKTITLSDLNTTFIVPDSACPGQLINFINSSNPLPLSNTWDFGDNSQSAAYNPVKTYTNLGTYPVKLVNHYSNCTDSVNKTITISDIVSPDFTGTNTGGCKAPHSTSFQNNTAGAVSWVWNFGDGTSSTQQNPTHVYTANGQYDVTLTVRTAGGCEGSITKTNFVKIFPGSVSVTNIPKGGCIPLSFTPIMSTNSPDPVVSYAWDFGDGGTSTLASPTHVYSGSGIYNLGLTVTTSGGCTLSVNYPGGVRSGIAPTMIDFSAASTNPCTAAMTQFTSTSDGTANGWLWDFGDGGVSTQQNPIHSFADTGTFTIKLTAMNNGCGTTVVKTNYITVLPPVARFSIGVGNCASPFTVNFMNNSILAPGLATYLWEFGNPLLGSSTASNTSFTFPGPGKYPVKLTVTNGGCTNSITDTIAVDLPMANFTISKPVVCKFEHFTLSAIADTSLIKGFEWTIGGGAPFNGTQTLDTSLITPGTYDITLKITDKYGCSNSITKPAGIMVSGPKASFSVSSPGGCVNTTISLNDASTSPVGFKKWTWNFGDGAVQDFTGPPYSHQYTSAGIYTVGLTVTDNGGCTDTASIPAAIKITSPKAGFMVENQIYCPGVDLQFNDTSSGSNLSYFWDFGNGNTATIQNPVNQYTGTDNNYTVKLQVTDDVGCSDSVTRMNYVQIRKPKAAFTFQDTLSICNLLETKFFFNGQDYASYNWDFGDGGSTTALNPSHFYNSYGNFTATLYLTGNGGCVDSATRQVSLINPNTSTQINYGPLSACNKLNVDFNITTPPQTVFSLYFGDGAIDSTQQITLQHLYSVPGYYFPLILLKDQYDCQASVRNGNRIQVLGAVPLYNIDRRKFCDSGLVYITNYTIANDPVVSHVWDLGDNTSSTDKDPIHLYTQPGLYPVTLTVTTQAGCTSSFPDTVRVLRTPNPIINGNDTICLNVSTPFNAGLAQPDTSITWKWDFGDGRNSTDSANILTYSQTGTYTVKLQATNSLGCTNSTSMPLLVAPNPTVTTKDVTITVGGSIQLPVTYTNAIADYSWKPSKGLSCDSCPTPVASPQFTTQYHIDVVDSNTCTASGNLTVTVLCTDKNYFVPNTFSPNGDGMNDIFYPRGNGVTRVQAMRIFNRWGQLIFEKKNFDANDPSAGWDGRVLGRPAPQDVYVYMIDFVCENAQIVPFKGNVALIR